MNVRVFRCDLDREVASLDTLDDEERARAAAFAFDHHRRRYIAAHRFLRATLGSALGVSPASLRFAATEHRKPVLVDHPSLPFNMSHADGVAYVAIGSMGELGVDVELHHAVADVLGVAKLVFSASEVAEISAASEDEQIARFLRCWTRKEAYVKALGVGLGAALTSITVGTEPVDIEVPPLHGISDVALHVRSLRTSASEYVAIAATAKPDQVELVESR